MDKKFIGIIGIMLIVCFLIISCEMVVPKNEELISNTSGNSNAAYVNSIFDKDKILEIYISLSETDYEDMLQNPTKEEYKQASITVNGETVDSVGFRVKGNSSLRSVASSDSDRYSFKLEIDHYIDGQSLDGLDKMNLNNCYQDASMMREYLSYELLNEMGIATPAFCFANVYINSELVGLYLAVESVEEAFATRYFGTDYGTIYKPYGEHGAGTDLVYTDDNLDSYSGLTAVTTAKNGSAEALLKMIKALNDGKDLEVYLDVEEILRYFAVNTVIVSMDSYQGQFTHNYFLYEKDGVFSILPWDYNMSFGGFGMGGNSQDSTALYIDQPVSGTTLEERPLLGKLLEVEEYKELYHQYIEEFLNGPFTLDKMQAEIERVANMIRPYLEKDPTKFYTMEQFETAISEGSQSQSAEAQVSAGSSPSVVQKSEEELLATDAQTGGTFPPVSEDGQVLVIEGQELAGQAQEKGERRDSMQGGGKMGGSSTGLVKFVRDRIENVTKQLNGEIPATGDTSVQSNGNEMGGQSGNQANRPTPPDGAKGMMPPDGMKPPDGMNTPDGMRGPNSNMGSSPGQAGINGGFGISTQQLYVLGGSILLLVAVLVFILKRRTKYSL